MVPSATNFTNGAGIWSRHGTPEFLRRAGRADRAMRKGQVLKSVLPEKYLPLVKLVTDGIISG